MPTTPAGDVVSTGRNRVAADARTDPARAAREQQSAFTPAAAPNEPSGVEGPPLVLSLVAVGSSLLVGAIVAVLLGGVAWLGAALLTGAAIGWTLLWTRMDSHERKRHGGPVDGGQILIPAFTIVCAAVSAGVLIVGAIAGYV